MCAIQNLHSDPTVLQLYSVETVNYTEREGESVVVVVVVFLNRIARRIAAIQRVYLRREVSVNNFSVSLRLNNLRPLDWKPFLNHKNYFKFFRVCNSRHRTTRCIVNAQSIHTVYSHSQTNMNFIMWTSISVRFTIRSLQESSQHKLWLLDLYRLVV